MYRFRCSKCGTINVGYQEFCLVCKTTRADARDVSINSTVQPIQTLRDVEMNSMVCDHCGASLLPNAKFCTKCGASVTHTDPASLTHGVKQCPQCLAEVPPNANFCTKCGHSFDQPSSGRDRSKPSDTCPACGASLMPNAKFCTKCGQRL